MRCIIRAAERAPYHSGDEALRAGLNIGGVGFIGVNVHGQPEAWVDAHEHVAELQLAVAGNAHAHD